MLVIDITYKIKYNDFFYQILLKILPIKNFDYYLDL